MFRDATVATATAMATVQVTAAVASSAQDAQVQLERQKRLRVAACEACQWAFAASLNVACLWMRCCGLCKRFGI